MTADVARAYRVFARLEARGRSPAYEALASAVAGTDRPSRDEQMTVLARDGRPLALADSHGTHLDWLG